MLKLIVGVEDDREDEMMDVGCYNMGEGGFIYTQGMQPRKATLISRDIFVFVTLSKEGGTFCTLPVISGR